MIRRTLAILLLLAAPAWAEVKFVAPTAPVPAYTLVRCELEDDQPGDAWWIVSPDENVDDITSEDGRRFAFVAPPGRYTIRALSTVDGRKDQGRAVVVILAPGPVPPAPTPTPTPNPDPTPPPGPTPGPAPSPQDPPGPSEFGLARTAYDLAIRLPDRSRLLSASVALSGVRPGSYIRSGHDDIQGMLNAAWGAMRSAGADPAMLDALAKSLGDLQDEGPFFDDAGYLDANRYGAALAEIADGLNRAGGSR